MPFTSLAAAKGAIRRGGLTLIAAGPGTGKSVFAQTIAQKGDGNGNVDSVLYFSADSSAFDIYIRAAAIATGRTMESLEQEIEEHGPSRIDAIVDKATAHMWMSFRTDPTEEYVVAQLRAYAEVHGAYPDLVVMDNLKNLDVGGEDEFRALEEASVFLSGIAKAANIAVVALQHVRGDLESGREPIPLSGIRGKVTKTPQLILTLYRGNDLLHVAIVKNRGGKADPTGMTTVPLYADLSRMFIQG